VTYGGDSGNRIFVLYWRCPLIRVTVIRGSTVVTFVLKVLLKNRFRNFPHNACRFLVGKPKGRTPL
jgi:hypothetical protein